MTRFIDRVRELISQRKSVLCIGLDSDFNRLPQALQHEADSQLLFNKQVIDATHDLVCCYKPNLGFYLSEGGRGIDCLQETIAYAHSKNIPVILDAKFNDIGHTAAFYAKAAFETLQADAVTLNPYMGKESIMPFADYSEKTLFILCYTSNFSRIDLQTQKIEQGQLPGKTLYQLVAEHIVEWTNDCSAGAVVGATAPEEMANIRSKFGNDIPILCPGIGTQGGDLEEILWAGQAEYKSLIVNVSRSILYASLDGDYAEAARKEAAMFAGQMRTFFEQAAEELGEVQP